MINLIAALGSAVILGVNLANREYGWAAIFLIGAVLNFIVWEAHR